MKTSHQHQSHSYQIEWIEHINQIPQPAWDELAQGLKTPFLEWDWLHNMEKSGSVGGHTGWLPHHLTVWRDGQLIGAAPLYIKGHSYGEFVFDHQWAEVAHRLGIQYYPKLLGMSPMTPAEGYRFLIAPSEDEELITELMLKQIDIFCDRQNISSCHFLYVDPAWRPIVEKYNFNTWLHHSFIWQNQSYKNFDDYLKVFNANQRRNIKRERQAIDKAGLVLQTLTGEELTHNLFGKMYHFYESTCDKFGWWGSKYLTKSFFEELYHHYKHRVLFVCAFAENDPRFPIGMSFCIYKGDRLYGRYWGSDLEIDSLHFNACYYTPIEWAIAHGIQIFDPGAGGRHKKRRGFPATPNHSLHRFYNSHLSQLFNAYINQINAAEQQEINLINSEIPFSQKSDGANS
jgi:predicted N-acyltransferase